MHPVRVYTYTTAQRLCVHADGTWQLEYVKADSSQLTYGLHLDETHHPKIGYRESHVLPRLGLKISRLGYRNRAEREGFDYYADIISVPEQGDLWTVRDLYLDVHVYDSNRVEILDTDEYLAAIQEGHLTAAEAAHALTALHAFVNVLARRGYDLDAYLQSEGVTLSWRKLKSTR